MSNIFAMRVYFLWVSTVLTKAIQCIVSSLSPLHLVAPLYPFPISLVDEQHCFVQTQISPFQHHMMSYLQSTKRDILGSDTCLVVAQRTIVSIDLLFDDENTGDYLKIRSNHHDIIRRS